MLAMKHRMLAKLLDRYGSVTALPHRMITRMSYAGPTTRAVYTAYALSTGSLYGIE
jgi:hypothetical protein